MFTKKRLNDKKKPKKDLLIVCFSDDSCRYAAEYYYFKYHPEIKKNDINIHFLDKFKPGDLNKNLPNVLFENSLLLASKFDHVYYDDIFKLSTIKIIESRINLK